MDRRIDRQINRLAGWQTNVGRQADSLTDRKTNRATDKRENQKGVLLPICGYCLDIVWEGTSSKKSSSKLLPSILKSLHFLRNIWIHSSASEVTHISMHSTTTVYVKTFICRENQLQPMYLHSVSKHTSKACKWKMLMSFKAREGNL